MIEEAVIPSARGLGGRDIIGKMRAHQTYESGFLPVELPVYPEKYDEAGNLKTTSEDLAQAASRTDAAVAVITLPYDPSLTDITLRGAEQAVLAVPRAGWLEINAQNVISRPRLPNMLMTTSPKRWTTPQEVKAVWDFFNDKGVMPLTPAEAGGVDAGNYPLPAYCEAVRKIRGENPDSIVLVKVGGVLDATLAMADSNKLYRGALGTLAKLKESGEAYEQDPQYAGEVEYADKILEASLQLTERIAGELADAGAVPVLTHESMDERLVQDHFPFLQGYESRLIDGLRERGVLVGISVDSPVKWVKPKDARAVGRFAREILGPTAMQPTGIWEGDSLAWTLEDQLAARKSGLVEKTSPNAYPVAAPDFLMLSQNHPLFEVMVSAAKSVPSTAVLGSA
ncbi:MAG: hypothetical protein ABH851_09840 [Methanobacteriota archaeon]